jgi:hypothetical protein
MAASHATSYLVWTQQVMDELVSYSDAILLINNEPAMSLVQDQRLNARSKHITIHYHFIKERYLNGEFEIQHVRLKDNLADLCTKALPKPALEGFNQRIQSGDDAIR